MNTRFVIHVLIACTMIVGLASCGTEARIEVGKSSEDLMKISSRTYNLKSTDTRKVIFECTSDVFDYAVSKIKDDTLREQLSGVEFHVIWQNGEKLKIEIKNVPTISHPESKKNVQAVLDRTKNRILGAFLLSDILFNGLDLERGLERIYEASNGFVLVKQNGNYTEEIEFNDQGQLLGSEIMMDGELVSVAKYNFEYRDDKYYLKSIKSGSQSSEIETQIDIEYVDYKGITIPKSLSGGTKNNSTSHTDVIKISRAHILS